MANPGSNLVFRDYCPTHWAKVLGGRKIVDHFRDAKGVENVTAVGEFVDGTSRIFLSFYSFGPLALWWIAKLIIFFVVVWKRRKVDGLAANDTVGKQVTLCDLHRRLASAIDFKFC